MADTASIAVGDAEDWGSEDDSCAARVQQSTAILAFCLVHPVLFLLLLFLNRKLLLLNLICLLLLYHIHVSLRHTLKLLPARKCTFHLFFPQRHDWTHTQTVLFCHTDVQNAIL